ncbi:MAG: hypothetical protein Kow0025_07150 [Thermodesulfovibrionales bacterium]
MPPERGGGDEDEFARAMAGVREIKEFREIPPKAPSGTKPRPCPADDTLRDLREIVEGKRRIRLSDTAEYVEWVTPGARRDTARRLHGGHFAVQDSIDLHGMSASEAEAAFGEFMRRAALNGLACVKVIHGRGLRSPNGPVLKEALKKWLHGPYRKRVAAYATARHCDGGLGATYILLRTRR